MSEKAARAHTSISNRARARDNADRKVVFKAVADNPFRVQWPSVPLNIQNSILACLLDGLTGVAEYHLSREQASRRKRKRSRAPPATVSSTSSKTSCHTAAGVQDHRSATQEPCTVSVDHATDAEVISNDVPSILRSLAIGINQVTKRLESLANSHRRSVNSTSSETDNIAMLGGGSPSPGCLVVACRADIDPPALIGHIPSLVAACNSRREMGAPSRCVWLVTLPKGAELSLAHASGLRRASVMLIEDPASCLPALAPLLQKIPLLAAPWLAPQCDPASVSLVPTHIKQLRTTAPKDMKAAKEKRVRDRTAARERRRSTTQSVPKRLTLSTSVGQNEPLASS
ncbi:hypothetical protein C8Q77DRAFT_1082354 [Trametes polyzona]|nr:hypothetical protein C8Q77DRAFT_1082354 [Trametes polyzona]